MNTETPKTPLFNLHYYDLIIINSSAGKDSLCAIYQICRMADFQEYDRNKIHVSHQDLGEVEWPGTKELAKKQADLFGLKIHYSKRRNKAGEEETFLGYVERRGKWPSNNQRYCTSDFKRGPGARIVTELTKDFKQCKVLYVFGFRADESPSRNKKQALSPNIKLTTKKRIVDDFLPIHHWDTARVWKTIKTNNLPYHPAYDLGMPRLSCCFCIFSPFDALVIAGKQNPGLLTKYIETEKKIKHRFRNDFSISEVKKEIDKGYSPENITDWVM